ncbi:cytochrome P450 [Schizophyllum amplum]|uniref:Cytochrome P450 n=1 Tax=Schizophyllum amplum TaxID=97359 RepID=A0A550CY63_9AGAR|nr:cytochrome P450 [Auriculariopsis ampla]
MFATAVLVLLTLVIARFVWLLFSRFVLRSPLDNIPGPPRESLLTGNFRQIFNPNAWAFHDSLAVQYGPVVRMTGLLGEKQLYVADPKALHHIVVKDQYIYEEHPQFTISNTVLFGDSLFSTSGDRHKKQRKLMNPVFSTAHMRDMIPIFQDVVAALRHTLEGQVQDDPQEIDMLHWMGRTALELIGRSGLGYSFDSLAVDDPGHPYAASIKELIPTMFRMFFARVYILPMVYNVGPAWFRRAIVNIVPWRDLHSLRDKVDLMWNTSQEIYAQKMNALRAGDVAVAKQIGQGRDILSLLIRANMRTDDPCSEDELLAQMSTLIFAAMDTTSSALSRILQLLALHPEVQDRMRDEIRASKKAHPVMTYDDLEGLTYVDAVCRETLRLFPPVPQLFRMTQKDVVMPFDAHITGVDGRPLSEVFVPAGTPLIISIFNANRNKAMWGEDATEWKPERWLAPLPESVTAAHMPGIYSHLMTFLGGGRACLGFKFSQLELKVVLAELLDAFKFSPSDKTVRWRMSNIVSAYVEEQPQKSQLPIVLSRAN